MADTSFMDQTNQALANTDGTSSDQVKMVGTDAHKKPLLARKLEEAARGDTLAEAKRLQPGQVAATVGEEARTKVDRISQLGSLSEQMTSLVEGKIQKGIAGAGIISPEVSESQLGQWVSKVGEPEKYGRARTYLVDLYSNPSLDSREKAILGLNTLGIPILEARRIVGLTVGEANKRMGVKVAEGTGDTISLSDIDVGKLGYRDLSELASDLGVTTGDIGDMSVGELQQKVREIKATEYGKVRDLKAKLTSLPIGSNQRDLIIRELKALGQAGVTGLEAEFSTAVKDIDMADVVTFGEGVTLTSEEILSDERLSKYITDYLEADPGKQAEMLDGEEWEGFRSWIAKNGEAIKAGIGLETDTVGELEKVRDEVSNISTVGGDITAIAIPGWESGKEMTGEELAAAKVQLNSTGVGQVILAASEGDAEMSEVLMGIKSLSPTELAGINQKVEEGSKALNSDGSYKFDTPADYLRAASKLGKQLTGNKLLADFLGVQGSPLQFDADVMTRAAKYGDVITKISKTGKDSWIKGDGTPNGIETSREFMKLSPETMEQYISNPHLYQSLETYTKLRNSYRNEGTNIEDIINNVILPGEVDVNLGTLRDVLSNITDAANFGDTEAAAFQEKFKGSILDRGGDGQLDDIGTIRNRLDDYFRSSGSSIVSNEPLGADYLPGLLREFRDLGKDIRDITTKVEYRPDMGTLLGQNWDTIKMGSLTVSDFERMYNSDPAQLDELLTANPSLSTPYKSCKIYENTQAYREIEDIHRNIMGSSNLASGNIEFGNYLQDLREIDNVDGRRDALERYKKLETTYLNYGAMREPWIEQIRTRVKQTMMELLDSITRGNNDWDAARAPEEKAKKEAEVFARAKAKKESEEAANRGPLGKLESLIDIMTPDYSGPDIPLPNVPDISLPNVPDIKL